MEQFFRSLMDMTVAEFMELEDYLGLTDRQCELIHTALRQEREELNVERSRFKYGEFLLYHVNSFTDPSKEYEVRNWTHEDTWTCTCEAFKYQKGFCKHIQYIRENTDKMGTYLTVATD